MAPATARRVSLRKRVSAYFPAMQRTSIVLYLNPWAYSRRKVRERLDALRARDGDDCRRCRRPMRFDLPNGHDQAPKLEPIHPTASDKGSALDNLCLTHIRCNASGADHTGEVTERMRRRSEAALLSRPRRRANRAA